MPDYNMTMNRITVSDIFKCPQPTTIVGSELKLVCSHQDYVFTVDWKAQLQIYSIQNFQPIHQIALPSLQVKAVQKEGKAVAVAFQSDNRLFIWDISSQIPHIYQTHLKSINSLITYGRHFVTASDDYTIRLWHSSQKQGTYALTGHQNRVTCLTTYMYFLVSGSSDKMLKLWHNKQCISTTPFSHQLVHVAPCISSSQLAVFTADQKLHLLNMNKVSKNRPILFNSIIQMSCPCLKACEIDDSFLVLATGNKIIYVEVNLNQIILEVDHDAHHVHSFGRMILLGSQKKGIQLLKL